MSAPVDTPKPKKSVALSGVAAGNTALCSVGRSGNDLHYRGYDILEVAETCEFEEIAYLLIHGKLPNAQELAAYKTRLKNLRGIPAPVRAILEQLPPATHPMDVMRTGASALGCVLPEANDHNAAGAREIADHLVASFGSMLCYWYHFSHSSRRIHVETDDDSVAGHFLHLLHRRPPSPSWVRAMHTSLNLYAEHEFNSSTFTARVIAGTGSDIYSCIAGAIGALRGPKHGGATVVALEIQERYGSPDEAEADIRRRVANKEIVIGFGHPVYTVSDPRNVIIKRVAEKLRRGGALARGHALLRRDARGDRLRGRGRPRPRAARGAAGDRDRARGRPRAHGRGGPVRDGRMRTRRTIGGGESGIAIVVVLLVLLARPGPGRHMTPIS
jgi:2-methylcitrate synthase